MHRNEKKLYLSKLDKILIYTESFLYTFINIKTNFSQKMEQNSLKGVEVFPGTPKTPDPSTNERNSRFKSDIQKAHILSYVYFIYVWKLIKTAFLAARQGKMINLKDLITFPWVRRADSSYGSAKKSQP